jgi:hypothetical protein
MRSRESFAKTTCVAISCLPETELGLFIFVERRPKLVAVQLNLPITPITDLRVHKGQLSPPRRDDRIGSSTT